MIRVLLRRFFRKQAKNSVYKDRLSMKTSSLQTSQIHLDFRMQPDNRVYVSIGERCIINGRFTFETMTGEVVIGNNVHIGNAQFICKTGITIEDDVTMAWGITIYDHNSHSIYWEERKNDNNQCYKDFTRYKGNNIVNKNWANVITKPIHISSKVWVGFNVTILKGITIGEGAVIGACSVVVKDVEPWTVVGGNPAMVIKKLK